MNTIAYVAINKNDEIREKSSSGAVFYELAKKVINNGGVVYGAKYDENWFVIHGHTDSIEGVNEFLGSKYVQSNTADEYKNVEKNLKEGRVVLFSGTPCQIGGLRCFLGKEYKRLITVDFICHGVPSPTVWMSYIDKVANGREVKAVNFRDKTEGWLRFSLRIDFDDGSVYRQIQQDDLYMKGFLRDIYLRPSCYKCKFKDIDRCSDFTLADYWGVNTIMPEMFDDKGTSLIMIHSEAGQTMWKSIKNSFLTCEVEIADAIKFNPNVLSSVKIPAKKRRKLFKIGKVNLRDLDNLVKMPIRQRAIRRVKKSVKKFLRRN